MKRRAWTHAVLSATLTAAITLACNGRVAHTEARGEAGATGATRGNESAPPADPHLDARDVEGGTKQAPPPGWEECHHPTVEKDCVDGWCRIPPGCFWMGSPEGTWARGMYSEPYGAAHVDHAFRIQQMEATRGEWTEAGFPIPTTVSARPADWCRDPECPVTDVVWFDVLAYANARSEQHDPPLQPCYELIDCTGTAGIDLSCRKVRSTTESAFDCEGFRVPSEMEWEYAARAGSRTDLYVGSVTVTERSGACEPDPALVPLAWYCANSRTTPHRGGEKQPNGWGLYDVVGNVFELTADRSNVVLPSPPWRDLEPDFTPAMRVSKGCSYDTWSSLCRLTGESAHSWDRFGMSGEGFRLVQTLR